MQIFNSTCETADFKKVKKVYLVSSLTKGTLYDLGNVIDRSLIRKMYNINGLGECDTYNMSKSFKKLLNNLRIDVTIPSNFEEVWRLISNRPFKFHLKTRNRVVYSWGESMYLVIYLEITEQQQYQEFLRLKEIYEPKSI